MEKKMYDYKGQKFEGEEVTFTSAGEQWCHYKLSDGSEIKAKMVLMEVVRLAAHDENGNPVYMFTAQQVLGIQPNPELVKKAN
jgi:hypothetical protein